MLTLNTVSNYLSWYIKEGSAMKLLVGILCAALLLLGASLLLCVCVIRNILRWIYAPQKVD